MPEYGGLGHGGATGKKGVKRGNNRRFLDARTALETPQGKKKIGAHRHSALPSEGRISSSKKREKDRSRDGEVHLRGIKTKKKRKERVLSGTLAGRNKLQSLWVSKKLFNTRRRLLNIKNGRVRGLRRKSTRSQAIETRAVGDKNLEEHLFPYLGQWKPCI